jgi:hypothetical protein
MSCLVLSCLVLSCIVLSCLVLSCLVLSGAIYFVSLPCFLSSIYSFVCCRVFYVVKTRQ